MRMASATDEGRNRATAAKKRFRDSLEILRSISSEMSTAREANGIREDPESWEISGLCLFPELEACAGASQAPKLDQRGERRLVR